MAKVRLQEQRDRILLRIWDHCGGAAFKPFDAWQCLGNVLQDEVLAFAYKHKTPWRSGVIMLGTMLADAADGGYRSGSGLGVVKRRKAVYAIARSGVVQRVEVVDRSAALEAVGRLEHKIARARAELDACGAELEGLRAAFERTESAGDIDDTMGDLLEAIAREYADRFVPLKSLASLLKTHAVSVSRFQAACGATLAGPLRLEAGPRDPRNGWRTFRVMLAE